ncbi:MAG TPA: ATP synthase F1 subunit delta [Candidatus Omnitrophota bacterium]|nr:ATP synthase F1 subunit delta [Candidatus Omnitrophota bacterium]HRZ14139.1 ATP synthase F1 subunit delta [Candidatus Omnitrophota bacterium]
MRKQTAAIHYAQAYYPFIRQRFQEMFVLLEAIRELFILNPDLSAFMQHPRFSAGEKKVLLNNAFGNKLPPEVERFTQLLIDRKRTALLPDIIGELRALYQRENGLQEIRVASAEPLTEERKARLMHRVGELLGKKVVAEFSVKQELLGGMVVHVGDKVIDSSIKNQLKRLHLAVQRKG